MVGHLVKRRHLGWAVGRRVLVAGVAEVERHGHQLPGQALAAGLHIEVQARKIGILKGSN